MSDLHRTIESALDWRYAVKKFDPNRKVSDNDWATLKKSLRLSPSSYGLQPYRFLLVTNPELRAQLKTVSWNQTQVTEASHFVVFLTRDRITEKDVDAFMQRIVQTRGVTPDSLKGYRDMLKKNVVDGIPADHVLGWTQRQAYIAMGFLLETAALLKIDSVPMEGLDPAGYDRVLKLEGSGWKTVAAVALGYRHPEDAYQTLKKVRLAEAEALEVR